MGGAIARPSCFSRFTGLVLDSVFLAMAILAFDQQVAITIWCEWLHLMDWDKDLQNVGFSCQSASI